MLNCVLFVLFLRVCWYVTSVSFKVPALVYSLVVLVRGETVFVCKIVRCFALN